MAALLSIRFAFDWKLTSPTSLDLLRAFSALRVSEASELRDCG